MLLHSRFGTSVHVYSYSDAKYFCSPLGYSQLVERAGSIIQMNEKLDVKLQVTYESVCNLTLLRRPRKHSISSYGLNQREIVNVYKSCARSAFDILRRLNCYASSTLRHCERTQASLGQRVSHEKRNIV